MSRSWDPWRVADDQQILPPRPVLAPSLVLQGKELELNKEKTPLKNLNDFISVLALVQQMEFDFLPITWHPALEKVGAGATAEIRQALVNVQTSFAFKRIGLEREDAFSALSSEISALGNPIVRGHDNIINLVGICWDVNPDGPTIWPVLVFEKATYDNLEEFMQSDNGRRLSKSQILCLMRDIGSALACLHNCNIIHGDIKPNNILVFKDDRRGYAAKVADFGYATRVTGNGSARLTISEPWTDPKYRGEQLDIITAKKLDNYSFGLVCVWLLHHISSDRSFQNSDKLVSHITQTQKFEDILDMLEEIPDLSPQQRLNLKELCHLTLPINRDQRSADSSHFLDLLGETRYRNKESVPPPALTGYGASNLSILGLNLSEELTCMEPDFQISKNLFRLLKADFRLPSFIAIQLHQQAEKLSAGETKSNAQFQLAVCHTIGFGVRRNLQSAKQWLSACGKKDGDLEREIEVIRAENRWRYQGSAVKSLEMEGSLELLDARFLQDAANILKQVERHYLEEIEDFQQVFDQTHSIIILTKFLLGNVWNKAGKYQKAGKLFTELGETMEEVPPWGPLHRSTLIMWTQAASMSFKLGKYAESEALYRKALEGQSSRLEPEHPETLSTTDSLSLALENQGKYQEAEELCKGALEGRKRVLGEEHPETLGSMCNLATILSSEGKYHEAEPLLAKSIASQRRLFGKGKADTMISLSNLAAIHNLMGNLAEAERLAGEVQLEMEETLGFEHPDTFYLLGNLASTMHALGKNERARELGNRLLERSDVIGIDNPYHLTVMSNMALMFQEEGWCDKSLEIDRGLLQRRISLLGEDHPDTLTTVSNIAAALQRQGKYTEAKEGYEKVLNSRQDVLGENHPATLATAGNLAYLLQQMGDYDSALTLHKSTLERESATLGPDHPATLMSKNNLGTFYLLLGDSAGAVALHSQVLEAQLKLLGESHPNTLQSMDNLAVAFEKLGQYEESEKYFRRELQNELNLGCEHLSMLNARNNLGMLLYGQDRLEEAKECIARALDGREKILGIDNPDTLWALFNMALIHFKENQYGPSIEKLRIVVEKRRKILGDDHPDTIRSLSNLATVLGYDGQYEEAEKLNRDVLDRKKRKLGYDHLESLAASTKMALALRNQGKLGEAEEILTRVVELRSQDQGEEHPQTIADKYYLALVRDDLGKHDEAEADLRYILKRNEQELGEDHEETVKIVNALGLVVRNQKKLVEAFQLLQRVLEVREKIPGGEAAVYETLALQALVRHDQGDLDAAKQLNERALNGWESLRGPENPTTLGVVRNLAAVEFQRFDLPEALRLHRRVLAGREKIFGSLHSDTIDSTRDLAIICYVMGSEEEALDLYKRAYDGSCQLFGPADPRSKEVEEEVAAVRREMEESGSDNNRGSGQEQAI